MRARRDLFRQVACLVLIWVSATYGDATQTAIFAATLLILGAVGELK